MPSLSLHDATVVVIPASPTSTCARWAPKPAQPLKIMLPTAHAMRISIVVYTLPEALALHAVVMKLATVELRLLCTHAGHVIPKPAFLVRARCAAALRERIIFITHSKNNEPS
jgi:hypothetical protein